MNERIDGIQIKKTVLFVPCYDGHIRVFAPVIKRMEEHPDLEPLVVFLKGVHGEILVQFLNEHHLRYVVLDLTTRPVKTAREAVFMYRLLYAIRFSRYLFDINKKVNTLFDEINPVLLITAETGFNESYFYYQARKRGIPSLFILSVMASNALVTGLENIQKYSLLEKMYGQFLKVLKLPSHRISLDKGHISKIAVWSEKHKQSHVERGIPADRIVITGSPAHDSIFQQVRNQSGSDIVKNYRQLDIDKDEQIILYTSQPVTIDGCCTMREQRRFTENIIRACSCFADYKLVIKLHPRESLSDYRYLNSHPLKNSFRVVSEKDSDLHDLIYMARAVITQSSSTGMDAILFDRDMIVIDYLSPVQDAMSYIHSGAALGVYKEDELLPALEKVLNDERTRGELRTNRKKFAADYTCRQAGDSAGRILELIRAMIYNEQKQYDKPS